MNHSKYKRLITNKATTSQTNDDYKQKKSFFYREVSS